MKLKKSFSVSLYFLIFTYCIFSFGCASKVYYIPGEKEVEFSNLYTEYYNLAEGYFNIGNYDSAIKYYKLAMKNKNNYWVSYYKVAKCYAYKKDWNEALPMYKKLLERDSENNSLKASVAYIYMMQNNVADAELLYEALLSDQPDNKEYLENYAALLLNQKEKIEGNKEKIKNTLSILQENYSESENVIKLQKVYDELIKEKPDNN